MASTEDLSPQAVKLARRIQNLLTDRAYVLVLIKRERDWLVSIQDDKGAKVELLK